MHSRILTKEKGEDGGISCFFNEPKETNIDDSAK